MSGPQLWYNEKELSKAIKHENDLIFFRFFWNLEMTKEATIEVKNDDEAADPIVFFNNETIGDRLAFNLPSTGKFNILLTEDGTTTNVAEDYVSKAANFEFHSLPWNDSKLKSGS